MCVNQLKTSFAQNLFRFLNERYVVQIRRGMIEFETNRDDTFTSAFLQEHKVTGSFRFSNAGTGVSQSKCKQSRR